MVLDSTQQTNPARFSSSTMAKTFVRSRPTTERRLSLSPSKSLMLHSCRKASKYSVVSTCPVIANSVMLLGCESKHERVSRAMVVDKRPYFSVNSRPASSECKSINTPPMSKTTALGTACCALLRLIVLGLGTFVRGFQHLTRHKICDREPGVACHAAKGWMADTPNVNPSLARGSLHCLVSSFSPQN